MDEMRGGDVLAAGTRLEEFEIERELGAGGFGVTYLAHDTSLDRQVAIKEYLPQAWGTRWPDGGVGPRLATHAENYRRGRERFLEEARVLARLRHPNVLQVHRVIEKRGTAYMVTEYVEGRSLEAALRTGGPWPESRVLALLDGLTAGLEPVHAAGLVHRDIKPANVMLRGDGSPVLIDFGAARQAMGQQSRAITTVLTPGYAPFEQYNTKGKQGPWTDVYALGAVAYEALSGRVPEEATARMEDDTLRPVAEVSAHAVSPGFADAIGVALALRGKDRPQTLADWRSRLGLEDAAEPPIIGDPPPPPPPPRPPGGGESAESGATGNILFQPIISDPPPIIGDPPLPPPPRPPGGGESAESGATGNILFQPDNNPPQASTGSSRRWRLAVAAVATVALTVAGLVWLASGVAVPETGGVREATERTGGGLRPGANAESVASETDREVAATEAERRRIAEAVEATLDLDRADWRRILEGLMALGFDPYRGGGARRAVRAYQEGEGKPATGFLDAADVTRLRAAASEEERRRLAELHRPGRVFRDCDTCPEMVVIPAGTFTMGSPAWEAGRFGNEGPRHEVTLRPFALGVTEVTFDEWDACVRGGGCNGYRPDDEGWGRRARPVINVNWNDARAYVGWLSESTGAAYRLPSESEWEYAARGGTTTPFHTGSTISTDQANYNGNHVYGYGRRGRHRQRTTPAGTFAPNEFGLYDVHGNVLEWVQDCRHDYIGAPSDGTAWERGEDCRVHVLRGGSWSVSPRLLRSASRNNYSTGTRNDRAGFRVSRTLD